MALIRGGWLIVNWIALTILCFCVQASSNSYCSEYYGNDGYSCPRSWQASRFSYCCRKGTSEQYCCDYNDYYNRLNTGAIIGISFGVLATVGILVAIVVVCCFCSCCVKKTNRNSSTPPDTQVTTNPQQVVTTTPAYYVQSAVNQPQIAGVIPPPYVMTAELGAPPSANQYNQQYPMSEMK